MLCGIYQDYWRLLPHRYFVYSYAKRFGNDCRKEHSHYSYLTCMQRASVCSESSELVSFVGHSARLTVEQTRAKLDFLNDIEQPNVRKAALSPRYDLPDQCVQFWDLIKITTYRDGWNFY
jgi:hypothetical protein